MPSINWRKGFFRIWVLLSTAWIVGSGIGGWPDLENRIHLARMSNSELIAALGTKGSSPLPAECAKSANPPPPGFVLDECVRALEALGRNRFGAFDDLIPADRRPWGTGDSYAEQAFRVARAVAPMFALLFVPPVILLAVGASIGWVTHGFRG